MGFGIVDIRALREAADRRSFSAAAAALDMSPQAISKRMRQLEALAGVPLFERASTGVELTAEGTQLDAAARRVASELAQFERVLARLGGGRPRVAIAVSPTLFEPFLIPGLRAYERRIRDGLHNLNTALLMANSDDVRSDVVEHRADFGIAAREPEDRTRTETPPLEERLLLVDEVVVAVGPNHQWATRDEQTNPVRIEEVARTPMTTRDVGSNVRHVFEAALQRRRLQLTEPASEVGAARLVIDGALEQGCPALLSRLGLLGHSELQIVPVYEDTQGGLRKVDVKREFVITYLDRELLSIDVLNLIDFLVDWARHAFPVDAVP